MAELRGAIRITKRLRTHDVWKNGEPFTYGQAWLDLVMLANDRPGTMRIHGHTYPLERGQVGWSLSRLEEQWDRSGEWITAFLKFCKEHSMIKVDSNRRRTIITILNYNTYNPSEPVTEPETVTESEPVTEPERKGELGRGKGKGEDASTTDGGFAEVPTETEVLAFAVAFAGDQNRGIPPRIPEAWALSWFAWRSQTAWPKKWRDDFTRRFTADWVDGNRKARSSAQNKKNAAGNPTPDDSRSPKQRRFELSRELEDLRARLDALHETGAEPPVKDQKRERELEREIKQLDTTVQT